MDSNTGVTSASSNPGLSPSDKPKLSPIYTVSIALLFLLLPLFVGAVWHAGFFKLQENEPTGQVVASALTLVGAFFGGIFALVGVLITSAIADRNHELARETARRHALEVEQNGKRAEEEAKRLKLEAGTKAVQLFSLADGRPAPKIQVAGALFTLSSLDYHELVMTLVSSLLEAKRIDGLSVTLLMDPAIKRGGKIAGSDAFSLLDLHAEMFVLDRYVVVPACIFEGPSTIPKALHWKVPITLAHLIMVRSPGVWKKHTKDFNYLVADLVPFWDEGSEESKVNIANILQNIMAPFPDLTIRTQKGEKSLIQLVGATTVREPTDQDVLDVVKKLQIWNGQASASPHP